MNFLKQSLARFQEQFSALNSSQKMLSAALVVIMVFTLWFWMRYASSPVMEPVLNQAFKEEDVARITSKLAAKGIDYQTGGDGRILVPADRRQEVLADLAYSQLLPRDTESGFNELMSQMSPWDSPKQTEMMMNKMKESYLSGIISRFPGVARAGVLIDPREVRRVGKSIMPTATVNIVMRAGSDAGKNLIQAAADTVAGAQAGLKRSQVTVIVDGVSHLLKDKDSGPFGDVSDFIQVRKQHEQHYEENIQKQLSYIRGTLVSVTVDLNTEARTSKIIEHDKTKTFPIEIENSNNLIESTGSGAAVGEPGVMANTGMSLTTGGGGQTRHTEERTDSKSVVMPSSKEEHVSSPAGDAKIDTVAVRVPRSYFEQVVKREKPDEPIDVAAVDQLIEKELPNIQQAVMMSVGLQDASRLTVATYIDLAPTLTSHAAMAESSTGFSMMMGGGVKEIAVGLLAVASLVMVGFMARGAGAAKPKVESRVAKPDVEELDTGETLAGEALEGSTMLDGMELDDDALRTQQMLSQVETLVKENPESAASLVKRWINK